LGLHQRCGRHPARVVMGLTRLLALLVMLVSPLSAQEIRAGVDSVSVVQLKPDRFVRIHVPELGRVQGRVGSRSATELVLQSEGSSRRVELAAVDTLWVRGRRTRTGAIIGGILGIGGGIFLGALGEALCEVDCDNHNYMVTGAIFGAAIGGATGAVIGTAIPRWRRIFPR